MQKVDGLDRVVPASETLERLMGVARSLGVTRLADITGLDRVGIPVYSSIVPRSADTISVYNGKGVRRIDAQVGAVMEAIERQTVLRARPPCIEGSFAALNGNRRLLDPRRVNHQLASDYSQDRAYSWIEGVDLVTGEACWVPAKLAGYLWDDVPHPSPFQVNDTNGLASGNCREEAICHALCELAERDTWSMAELIAHELPRQRRALAFGVEAKDGEDDLEVFPCLDVSTLDPCSQALMASFQRAGLSPVVRDITSSLQVPTIFASVVDEQLAGFPMAHSGLGASPDVRVAIRRALTEVAQSRCVDIQAVREDLLPPDAPEDAFALHTRRISAVKRGSWCLDPSLRTRAISEIPSHATETMGADVAYLLQRFLACGLHEILVVDFTPKATDHSVVRVIVPGIEFWATDRGRLGTRAVETWKRHA